MGSAQFPARLSVAIERWHGGPNGVSAFAKEMGDRKARGASRGQIRTYLAGKTAPPLDFIETAAEVTGVPFAWLATGAGSPPPMRDSDPESLSAAIWMVAADSVRGAFGEWLPGLAKRLDDGSPVLEDATSLLAAWPPFRELVSGFYSRAQWPSQAGDEIKATAKPVLSALASVYALPTAVLSSGAALTPEQYTRFAVLASAAIGSLAQVAQAQLYPREAMNGATERALTEAGFFEPDEASGAPDSA